MICNECETVAHCSKHGCNPKQPAQLPFGVKGCLVAIKTLLSRDPRVHANTAIKMIDALLANEALDKAITALREALAEQPDVPETNFGNMPAQRKPLTDDDVDVIWAKLQTQPFKTHAEDRMAFARALEAAHGIKE